MQTRQSAQQSVKPREYLFPLLNASFAACDGRKGHLSWAESATRATLRLRGVSETLASAQRTPKELRIAQDKCSLLRNCFVTVAESAAAPLDLGQR